MVEQDFEECLRRWKDLTNQWGQGGGLADTCGVWVGRTGRVTKLLTRRPHNKNWTINVGLVQAFDVLEARGVPCFIRYGISLCIQHPVTGEILEDLALERAAGQQFELAWQFCNPKQAEYYPEWYTVSHPKGYGGPEWDQEVERLVTEVYTKYLALTHAEESLQEFRRRIAVGG